MDQRLAALERASQLASDLKQALPNALVLVYTAQPEAWQISFAAGVVPPCARSHELVEEICAWLAERYVCC